MRWCTVELIYLDRVASLWLIRRYVDPAVEFAFVPRATGRASSRQTSYPSPSPGPSWGARPGRILLR